MNFPLYDLGLASGLFSGMFFGYALEAAGFASPRKLTAQFSLRDFGVIKVMLTAALVAAVGLYVMRQIGVIGEAAVYVPTTYFWAMLAGGALIGGGFAMGGYCPGTSLAGIATGRIDAIIFAIGMVGGITAFGYVYEPLQGFYFAAKGPEAGRLTDLLGLPEWLILAVFTVIAVAAFRLGTMLERRNGGPVSALEACTPVDQDPFPATPAAEQQH